MNLNHPPIITGPLTDRDLLDQDFGDVPAGCNQQGQYKTRYDAMRAMSQEELNAKMLRDADGARNAYAPTPAEACTELGADCEPPTWLDLAWLYVTLAGSLVALCALAGYVIGMM